MDQQKVKSLIEDILRLLKVSFEAVETVSDVDVHPIFFIRTSDSHLLIGARGEHLKALNLIVKLMTLQGVAEEASPPRFLIDVNGYHTKRIRDLKASAKILADRVRMFRSPIEMSPMNAYDRMIVHSAFASDPEISTESEGEGKFRRIVLKYKTKSD